MNPGFLVMIVLTSVLLAHAQHSLLPGDLNSAPAAGAARTASFPDTGEAVGRGASNHAPGTPAQVVRTA